MPGDGLSVKELSRRMGLSHSTVSGIVDRLERRGLVARRVQRTARAEAGASRLVHVGLLALAFALTLTGYLRLGPLAVRWVPFSPWLYAAGVAIAAAGMAFATWARLHLGAYWSGRVAIKAEHRLVRSGPYRLVRHPIYTGILVGVAAARCGLSSPSSGSSVRCGGRELRPGRGN